MTGGPADFGVFRGDGGGLTPVFAANRIAPGGATFVDFGDPVINRHGQVAAFASLSNGASRGGLFIGAGTDAVPIALQGEAAPKGGSYREHDAFLVLLDHMRDGPRGWFAPWVCWRQSGHRGRRCNRSICR